MTTRNIDGWPHGPPDVPTPHANSIPTIAVASVNGETSTADTEDDKDGEGEGDKSPAAPTAGDIQDPRPRATKSRGGLQEHPRSAKSRGGLQQRPHGGKSRGVASKRINIPEMTIYGPVLTLLHNTYVWSMTRQQGCVVFGADARREKMARPLTTT